MSTEKYEPRRGKPGQAITVVDTDGSAVTVKADKSGVIRPRNASEQRATDLYRLPVARSAAKRAPKPAAKRAAPKRSKSKAATRPTTSDKPTAPAGDDGANADDGEE